MSIEYVCLGFLILCLMGVPIAISIAATSALYFFMADVPFMVMGQRVVSGADSFPLLAAPLFMLAGVIMSEGGIMRRLLRLSDAAVGHFTGGLAQVNVFSSLLLSGMSGSATALASTGTVIIPAMVRSGYPAPMSAAITASSSVIGPILPPSVPFVIYGAMAQVSIGKLFIGTIIPGLMLTGLLMATVWITCRKAGYRSRAAFDLGEFVQSSRAAALDLGLPVIIIGGLMGGFFTPVEAAGVAAIYAILLEVVIFREISLKKLPRIILQAARLTGIIMFVVAVSNIFGWILVREGGGQLMADFLLSISDNVHVLRIMLVVMLLLFGLLIETVVLIVLIVPVLSAIAPHLAMDPIHLGVTTVLAIMIGLITPPVGLCMFIVNSIAKISVTEYTRAIMPSFIAMLLCVFLVALVPPLTTWLPSLLMP